jgi:hypothetical protein
MQAFSHEPSAMPVLVFPVIFWPYESSAASLAIYLSVWRNILIRVQPFFHAQVTTSFNLRGLKPIVDQLMSACPNAEADQLDDFYFDKDNGE